MVEWIVDTLKLCYIVHTHSQLFALLSVDGYCLVHSTSGELLHKVTPQAQWIHPHLIKLTRNGQFVVHYADRKGGVASFTCNGKQLCERALPEPALVRSFTICTYVLSLLTKPFSPPVYVYQLDVYV